MGERAGADPDPDVWPGSSNGPDNGNGVTGDENEGGETDGETGSTLVSVIAIFNRGSRY